LSRIGGGAAGRRRARDRRLQWRRGLGFGAKGGGADRRRVPRGRCGAYIGAEQTALACGPRAGRRGGAQPDSTESRSATGGGRPRQAGPSCRWLREEKAGTGRAGEKEKVTGRRWDFGLREGKRKRRAGPAWAENEFFLFFLFANGSNKIKLNSNSKNSNSN